MNPQLHHLWNAKKQGEAFVPEKPAQGREPQHQPQSILLKQSKPR